MHHYFVLAVLLLPVASLHGQTPTDASGAQIFATAGCTHCHGDAGLGTENAPSLRSVRKQTTVAQMTQQIANGGQTMPPFGEILDAAQIARVVDFLRSPDAWKGKPKGPESKYKAPPLPPATTGQPAPPTYQ